MVDCASHQSIAQVIRASEHRASSNVDAAQICKLSSLFTLTKLRHFTPALPRRQTRQEYASGSISDNEATGKTSSVADAGSVLSLTSLIQRYCYSPMPSTTTYNITLKLDLDLQTTFHVVERGWSAGLASIYMSVYEILVNCRFGMKLSASVSSPSYTGAQKQNGPDPMSSNVDSSVSDDASWKAVLFGSGASPAVASVPTVPTVPFVPIVATVPVVATTVIAPLAATVSTAPVHSGAVVKYCKPSTTTIAAAVSTGSAVVKFIPLFPIYVQSAPVATSACAVVRRIPYYSTFSIPSCVSLPGAFNRTFPSVTPVPLLTPALADVAIVSSEASAEAPIEVPTEAACSAVESAFSPAVAAQAMVSVPDCDVAVSPLCTIY
ncbi:hypothetical protein BASA60_001609 [Batrachochytrium salamandrivorans]|nr:hypothetical protein BASA60_001609 [Batrachochytrium salamandrivorans]